MAKLILTVEERPTMADKQALALGLSGHLAKTGPADDLKEFAVFLRGEAGQVTGGILGFTQWGAMTLTHLWLHEKVRGQGHGKLLLEKAEVLARKRDCRLILVDCFDFQPVDFFAKRDYRVYGTLDNHPEGHKRFYLRKTLTPNNKGAAP